MLDFLQLIDIYESYNIIKMDEPKKSTKNKSCSKQKQKISSTLEIKIPFEDLEIYFIDHALFSSV